MLNIHDRILEQVKKCISNIDLSDSIIVLKGIDNGILGDISLKELFATKKTQYWLNLYNSNRRVISYEEYIYLYNFIEQEFENIYVIDNNIYNHFYPLNVEIDLNTKSLLVDFFDYETDDNISKVQIFDGEEYIKLYSNFKQVNETYFVRYNDPLESQSLKLKTINLFDANSITIPCINNLNEKEDSNILSISEPSDYLKLLEQLLSNRLGNICIENYIDDKDLLLEKLGIINTYITEIKVVKKALKQSLRRENERVNELLKEYWGHNKFRTLKVYDYEKIKEGEKLVVEVSQENIINDMIGEVEQFIINPTYDYKDIFVTAPTGAGKSIMFLLPAMYLAEKYNLITLIISPLIGLMNDQVDNIKRTSYQYARTINSDISPVEKEEIINDLKDGKCHILYLSPESLLARSDISQLIGDRKIGMVIIDEAHIVTTWGKQFRPDYWYLGDYIKKIRKNQAKTSHPFLLATFTATAIYGGIEDMYNETLNSLSMHSPITYLGYVKRDDIDIKIKELQTKTGREEYELDKFESLINVIKRAELMDKKTLIYFPTVRLIESFYSYCITKNIANLVTRYNGQMLAEDKIESADLFKRKEKLVMLATKAFGMGIDISDIEIVCHFSPTGNVCDYVQEIGRVARDKNLKGEALYYHMKNDFKHINRLHGLSAVKNYQLIKVIQKIYELFKEKLLSESSTNQVLHLSKKRNELLVDAENFTYIFEGPLEQDENDLIAKVKTALLLIQKDYEAMKHYSPIKMRPTNLYAKGFFQVPNDLIDELRNYYGNETFVECFNSDRVYLVDLHKIWKKGYEKKHSFPKFKHLIYTKSEELSFLSLNKLVPSLQVKVSFTGDYSSTKVLNSMFEILKMSANNDFYVSVEANNNPKKREKSIANYIHKQAGVSLFKANSMANILISTIKIYNRNYNKSLNSRLYIERYFTSNTPEYMFARPIYDFINWVLKLQKHIKSVEQDGVFYIINNSHSMTSKEIITVLGLLEATGYLRFEASGGMNSQIYLHINETKTMQQVISKPSFYKNHLLEKIAERHKISVAMMSFLYQNNLSSDEIWNYVENYFLGHIPEEINIDEVLS